VNLFVLDVSVAVKWALPDSGEKLTTEALELLNRFGKAEVEFIVPDLFWLELGNALWKAARIGRCGPDDAAESMAAMRARGLATLSSGDLLEQALSIAITFDRTMYDSVYVALAVKAQCQLLTADERLANALAMRLPVKWLGAL
jgi:predicted nucleic acid-binding protein